MSGGVTVGRELLTELCLLPGYWMIDTAIVAFCLILILALGFLIRSPYLNFPMDEDAGLYTYLPYFQGRIRLFVDFWGGVPMTLPAILCLLYSRFGRRMRTVRIFACLCHAMTVLSVFALSDLLFGVEAGLISALLFSLYASVPFLTWFSAHNENYYLLPVTWGLFFFITAGEGGNSWHLALAGALFGLGFLFKIVVAAYAGLLGLHCIIAESPSVLYFLSGFLVPVILYGICVVYGFWGQNHLLVLHTRLRTLGFFNISWQKWNDGSLLNDLASLIKQTMPVWAGAGLYFVLPWNHPLWVYGAATLLIFLAQRGFSSYHYLPIIHLLSIQAGGVLYGAPYSPGTILGPVLWGGFCLLIVFHLSWTVRRCLVGAESYSLFDKSDQYCYLPSVAEDLKKRIPEGERLYVWGSYTQIYQMCDRPATDRYVHFFMGPFRSKRYAYYYDTIIEGIKRFRPAYILQTHHTLEMSELCRATGLKYEVERVYFNKFRLWRLAGNNGSAPPTPETWEEKNSILEKISSGRSISGLDPYYLENGMAEQGEKECGQALELNPWDFENMVYLGAVLREKGDFMGSLAVFDDILARISHKRVRYNAYLNRALTFHRVGGTKEALYDLDMAMKLYPESPEVFAARGVILREIGSLNQAIDNFARAEELLAGMNNCDRELARVCLNRGMAWKLKGVPDKAFADFKRAGLLDPHLKGVRLETGVLFVETGRLEAGLRELKEESKRFPHDPNALLHMGIASFRVGEPQRALELFDNAAGFNPEPDLKRYIYYQKGSVLEEMKRWEEARQAFETYLALDKSSNGMASGVYFHLGRICRKMAETERAADYFKECLRVSPNHEAARKGLAGVRLV